MGWKAVVAGLAVAVLLSACGGVRSNTPLFTARDASVQRLHPGVWVVAGPGCDLGAAPTVASLPECALAARIAGGRLTFIGRMAEGDRSQAKRIVLVENRPMVLQSSDPSGQTLYYGVRPTALDPTGRITRGMGWVLVCPGGEPFDQCTVDTPTQVRARAAHMGPMQSAFLTWIGP